MNDNGRSSRWLIWISFLLVATLSSLVTAVYFLRVYQKPAFYAVSEAGKTIEDNYYFIDESINDQTLSEAALRGMVGGIGDAYAAYFTNDEYDAQLQEDSGEYVGIGISVQEPDDVGSRILNVYAGGPMEEAGVRPGDVIIEINGIAAKNLSLDVFLSHFTEGDDETDTIVIKRGEERFTVTVAKRTIHVPRVYAELLSDGKTGYIRIEEFLGSVATEFADAIADLRAKGALRLVIDLRNNPGGGLTEVLECTDCVLDEGELIASVRGRSGKEDVYKAKREGVDLPIAILINGYSASGSEMFTGALKDNGRAVVVGTTTFGKGIVQSHFRLSGNGGWVKLTTDAYYTPSGKCIHGEGISPNIEVDIPDEDGDGYVDITTLPHDEDPQLLAALAALDRDQL